MSAWRALVLLAVAPASAIAGCSLLVSTDGLSGSAAVAPGNEGGPDTSTAGDGGADVTADGADASALPFCDSLVPKPKLCADFDTGSLTDVGRISGGPPVLDGTVARSPPRALLATVETNATNRYSKVVHDFPDTPTSFVASFDVYFEEYDATHDVELVSLQLRRSTSSSCIVDVSVRMNAWTMDESCDGTPVLAVAHRSGLFMKLSRWTHIELATDFSLRTFSLAVDGDKTFADAPIQPGLASGVPSLGIGIAYLQANATRSKARFDNVVFDYK